MVGSMAVHQLHYALAHDEAVAVSGAHAYLPVLAMAAGLSVVGAGAWFVHSVRAARAGSAVSVDRSSYVVRWLALATALVTVFVVQEAVEAAAVAGPAAALTAGHGVLNAALLSLAVAAILALLLTGADAVIQAARCSRRVARTVEAPSWRPQTATVAARNVLSENLAGRAPPLGI